MPPSKSGATKGDPVKEQQADGAAVTPDRWQTKAGLAQHFSISIRSVTNLMRRRAVPYVKVGRLVRFDLPACEKALKKFEIVSVE